MGMMVLHSELDEPFAFKSILSREVLGMEIVGDQRRLDGEQIFEMFNSFRERVQRLVIFQVADMVTHEGVALFAQTKGIFKMSPARQDRWNEGHGHGDGLWCIAARAADQQFSPLYRPRHRVVAAHVN